jgi:hypothetical protein
MGESKPVTHEDSAHLAATATITVSGIVFPALIQAFISVKPPGEWHAHHHDPTTLATADFLAPALVVVAVIKRRRV